MCSLLPHQLVAQEAKIESATIRFEFVSKKVKGEIAGFKSTSKIDWANLEGSEISGSVDVATVDTNNGLRNWSLKGSRYFNAKAFPTIQFKSKSISEKEGKLVVSGDLTLKETTKPIEILFERKGNFLKGKASLYTSDFDIKIKKKRGDNLVNVYFDLKLVL